MCALIDTLKFLRSGGQTIRYHTVPRIEQERVGQHSFGVAWLVYLLTQGKPSAALLLHAMAHDLPECETGDMPGPTKRRMGLLGAMQNEEHAIMTRNGLEGLPDMSFDECRVLKAADYIDGMLSCARERALGNKTIEDVYYRFESYAAEMLKGKEHEVDLIEAAQQIWKEACA